MTPPVIAGPPTPLERGDEFIYELKTYEFEVLINDINFADKGRYSTNEKINVVVDGFGLDRRGPKARINETVSGETNVFVTYFDNWFDIYQEGVIFAKNTYTGYPNSLYFIEPTVGITPRENFAFIPYLVTNNTEAYGEAEDTFNKLGNKASSGFPNNNASSISNLNEETSVFEFSFYWQSADRTINQAGKSASFYFDFSMKIVLDIKRSIVSSLNFSFYSITSLEDTSRSRKLVLDLVEVKEEVVEKEINPQFVLLGLFALIIWMYATRQIKQKEIADRPKDDIM